MFIIIRKVLVTGKIFCNVQVII